jgi:hypothetical protein
LSGRRDADGFGSPAQAQPQPSATSLRPNFIEIIERVFKWNSPNGAKPSFLTHFVHLALVKSKRAEAGTVIG